MARKSSTREPVTVWVECQRPDICGVKRHKSGSHARRACARGVGAKTAESLLVAPELIQERQGAADVLNKYNKVASGRQFQALVVQYRRDQNAFDTLKIAVEEARAEERKAGRKPYSEGYYELADRLYRARMDLLRSKKVMDDRIGEMLLTTIAHGERTPDQLVKPLEGVMEGVDAHDAGESGSIEWLMHRQTGFGGSDAHAVIFGKKADHAALIASKVEPITEGQKFFSDNIEEMTAAQRGNMIEGMNALEFQAANPHLDLRRDKRTFRKVDDPDFICNFDGLVCDESGDPVAVWESKSTDNWKEWENGIPLHVQAQLDHQMYVSGTDTAYVTVRLNGGDVRTFTRTWGEKLQDPDDPLDPGTMFTDHLDKFRDLGAKVRNGDVPDISPKPRRWTPKVNDSSSSCMKGIFGDEEEVNEYLTGAFADEEGNLVSVKDTDRFKALMSQKEVPAERRFLVMDTETTGFSRSTNEVVELGAAIVNGRGEVIETISGLFSPHPNFLEARGTGAEHVHGITPDDVRGKPTFRENLEFQEKLASMFERSDAVLGHNVGYDMDMLLHASKRVREAAKGKSVVDTLVLAQYFMHDSPSNTLDGMRALFGVNEGRSHRALDDALTTSQVFQAWMRREGIRVR